MKFSLQRSWNFYKAGYGTLSLFIYHKNKLPNHWVLFHWLSMPTSEVNFRFDVLRKIQHPAKDYISHCVYGLWCGYGQGLRHIKLTKLERWIGKLAIIRIRLFNGEKLLTRK